MSAEFRPAWWLRGPNAQTLWAGLVRRRLLPVTRRERLELPDGDFVDLDWLTGGTGPVVIMLHGLEGSLHSPYAGGMLAAIGRQGWRGVMMHFRGCSGEPNRQARSYHSGETGDLRHLVRLLKSREPRTTLAAVGFSLGGNALLKYLGEEGTNAGLDAAVAVSVPFDLAGCAERLQHGFSRLYQWHLLRGLRRKTLDKLRRFDLPLDRRAVEQCRDFRQFDDRVTAPLHGFAGVDDYYRRCSSRQFLGGISVPTLALQAADDPFMSADVIPSAAELSPAVRLEVSTRGGHVGFISGRVPFRAHYWLEDRVPAFLREHLD
jgi:hypothetical protein